MLTTLLDWLAVMLSMNKKTYVIGQIMILRIFVISKRCAFGKITKSCWIDSTPWVGSMGVVIWEGYVRWLWFQISLEWMRVKRSDEEKGKLTFQSFKRRCQLIIRLKAIKSIKKLLYFLSSYINYQSSNLCNFKLIGIIMMEAFDLMVDL